MISEQLYNELKARYERLEAWRGNRRSYSPYEVPEDCIISNSGISSIELYEFVHNPPDSYFAYIDLKNATMTTWTGEKLGDIVGGWHNTRGKWLYIQGVNGCKYRGQFYPSAGDYIKVKRYD